MIKTLGYPPEHTFLLGFSQGAALTYDFAFQNETNLAGYIAISGRIENLNDLQALVNKKDVKKLKFLVTHGSQDYNLSYAIAKDQVNALNEMGLDIDFRQYEKAHEFDNLKELPEIARWISQAINS